MNRFIVSIEDAELASAVYEMLKRIEGIQIETQENQDTQKDLNQEQAFWLAILRILAEFPVQYLPLLFETIEALNPIREDEKQDNSEELLVAELLKREKEMDENPEKNLNWEQLQDKMEKKYGFKKIPFDY